MSVCRGGAAGAADRTPGPFFKFRMRPETCSAEGAKVSWNPPEAGRVAPMLLQAFVLTDYPARFR